MANWKVTPEIKAGIESFLALVEEREAVYKENFEYMMPSVYTVEEGIKNLKVISAYDGGKGQRSVFAFIEKATGDIYKPATWKAAAKHVRGNVLVSNGGTALSGGFGSMPSIRYL